MITASKYIFIPRRPQICFWSLSINLDLLKFNSNRVIQNVLLSDISSFTQNKYFEFTHVEACKNSSLLLYLSIILLYGCITICLSSYQLMDNLSCFQTLDITNKTARSICACLYMDICFHFSWINTLEWDK